MKHFRLTYKGRWFNGFGPTVLILVKLEHFHYIKIQCVIFHLYLCITPDLNRFRSYVSFQNPISILKIVGDCWVNIFRKHSFLSLGLRIMEEG